MKKQENRLALSVLSTLIATIALIYTLIVYHHIIFAVAGVSLLFLICAYILTQNLIAFSITKSNSMSVHIKDCADDISSQLDAIHHSQSQIGKATFLYTKQAAQAIAMLENNYAESQEALYKNLTSITNTQNKATKLMIKYDQNNTTKVISTIKELRNQLSDTMIHGFDQIQPNNADVIAALEDIVDYLKTQPTTTDQTLGLQLDNVAKELQNISNSIQLVQGQNTLLTDPVQPVSENIDDLVDYEEETYAPADFTEEPSEETISEILEDIPETISIPEIEEVIETNDSAPIFDPNKQLSADEIAALFAAAEPTPKQEEPIVDVNEINNDIEDEPFTPTFTVVGKSTSDEANDIIGSPEPMTIGDLTEDPNKQLSADEIAALFAAADPVPQKEENTIQEPSSIEPVTEDPNKQLSADEIAALFAAAEPAPKKETSDEEKRMDEAIANAEPVNVTPVSVDPNKQLSADEIAALFASLG